MIDIPVQLSEAATQVLRTRLPQVPDIQIIIEPEWDGSCGRIEYWVHGTLPSGKEYDVQLDIHVKENYAEGREVWVASTLLNQALDKAVQAFRVAIALEGEPKTRHFADHYFDVDGGSFPMPGNQIVDVGVYGFQGQRSSVYQAAPHGLKDLVNSEEWRESTDIDSDKVYGILPEYLGDGLEKYKTTEESFKLHGLVLPERESVKTSPIILPDPPSDRVILPEEHQVARFAQIAKVGGK